MTTKILDNTVISASISEIVCIDFIDRCSKIYEIETTYEVCQETKYGYDINTTNQRYRRIRVIDLRSNGVYKIILKYLENRYPYLHKGELSTFLLSLLHFEFTHKNYIFVTDDQKMRKLIPQLKQDTMFQSKLSQTYLSQTYTGLRFTGTIGLIKRLKERNAISVKEIEEIIKDLNNSTFHITQKLIDYLRS